MTDADAGPVISLVFVKEPDEDAPGDVGTVDSLLPDTVTQFDHTDLLTDYEDRHIVDSPEPAASVAPGEDEDV